MLKKNKVNKTASGKATGGLVQHGFGKSGGSVLRRHICGENRHLRQAANRYSQPIQQKISSKIERDLFVNILK